MSHDLASVLRLLLAAGLGAAIGAQREWSGRPAGLRTLALISMGAALFAIISEFGFTGANSVNIGAGVVTGIGFLGAGVILHRHSGVEGLTTAASVWLTAGIGLAVGAGFFIISIATTIIALIILFAPHIPPRNNKK